MGIKDKSELQFKRREPGFVLDVLQMAMPSDEALRNIGAAAASMVAAARNMPRFDAAAFVGSFAPQSEQIARAIGALARSVTVNACESFVREVCRQAEEMEYALDQWLADMPAEEREELRRAIKDAPLCEVDVNAVGEM
jgi:hypothetical protein